MSDKIQMTEEQARDILKNCLHVNVAVKIGESDLEATYNSTINIMKQKGYIKKSDLEIAIDKFEKKFFPNIGDEIVLDPVIANVIIEQKKEIERLKNERL